MTSFKKFRKYFWVVLFSLGFWAGVYYIERPKQPEITKLPTLNLGEKVEIQFMGLYGKPPYNFRLEGEMPPGLEFDPNTGRVTGVVQKQGNYQWTIHVRDSEGNPAGLAWGAPSDYVFRDSLEK